MKSTASSHLPYALTPLLLGRGTVRLSVVRPLDCTRNDETTTRAGLGRMSLELSGVSSVEHASASSSREAAGPPAGVLVEKLPTATLVTVVGRRPPLSSYCKQEGESENSGGRRGCSSRTVKALLAGLVVVGAGMLLAAYFVGAFSSGAFSRARANTNTNTNTNSSSSQLCGEVDPRHEWSDRYDIWPQVYSQNGPAISSWEYKVNCGPSSSSDDHCFLSDLSAVIVTTPANEVISLDRDFNTNPFSGEVTRRWVKYGPSSGTFPLSGEYTFEYFDGEQLVLATRLPFCGVPLPLPQDASWTRSGSTRTVVPSKMVPWSEPPSSVGWIKVLVFDESGNVLSVVVSKSSSGTVFVDAPLIDGGSYSASVAFFWDDGYAYTWDTLVW